MKSDPNRNAMSLVVRGTPPGVASTAPPQFQTPRKVEEVSKPTEVIYSGCGYRPIKGGYRGSFIKLS